MKKGNIRFVVSGIIAIVCIVFVLAMFYCFNHYDAFRSQFIAGSAPAIGELTQQARQQLAERNELVGQISFFIFIGLFVLQFAALLAAQWIIGRIKVSADSVDLKFKQLNNADIFFDLPLYIGLFGTVSSFVVMTFSPGSLLIAYSSTLVGIVFSIILRLTLLYPMRSRLLVQDHK